MDTTEQVTYGNHSLERLEVNNMSFEYKCPDCKHNKELDNETIDFCEICDIGFCVLCTWKYKRECKHFGPKLID